MAKPSTKGLLKEILSDDIERVYVNIAEKAVEWAVAGFIDEANSLLEQLWKFNIPHSRDLWLPDEGLQVLWTLSGKMPSHIPFEFKEINEIEKENWSRCFYACGGDEDRTTILSKQFAELDDEWLFFKAINAGYDHSETPPVILMALKRFVKTEYAAGYTFFHATSCGALLAAKNNCNEEAVFFIKLWGQGYFKYWNNYTLGYLMRDRATAAFLLKGTLAPVFQLTKEICDQETKEIIAALAARMESGRTLVYKALSWNELLNKISALAIEQTTIDFSDEILKNKTLCRPPATSEAIQSAEKRLGINFPVDYKEFLLTSNGFENFSYTGVTLSSIDKVDFLMKIDEQLIDIWSDSMDTIDAGFGEKLKSSLVIGGLNEEQYLLLIPLPSNQWECWHFSSWRPGEVVYESFRFYIEYELQCLEDNLHSD